MVLTTSYDRIQLMKRELKICLMMRRALGLSIRPTRLNARSWQHFDSRRGGRVRSAGGYESYGQNCSST